jgi:hypothetical protein
MDYTVEIYKLDKRMKDGQKLVSKTDIEGVELSFVEALHPRRPGYIVMIHETYVKRTNMMSGREYQERYDTPRSCSPSSEAYWTM